MFEDVREIKKTQNRRLSKLVLRGVIIIVFFTAKTFAGEGCINSLLACNQATFDTLPTIAGTETTEGIALVDLDSDGQLDLAVSDFEIGTNAEKVAIYRGFGNGSFSSPIYVTAGSNPGYITSGDFNNDGKIDLAVTTSQSGSAVVNNVAILINQSTPGNISLTGTTCAANDPRCPSGGNLIQNIAVGRINNDNFLDLAVANNNDSVNSATLFYGTGNGNFSTPLPTIFSDRPWFVSLADIDGVNGLDLIAAIGDTDKIEIKYNDGNGNLPQSTFRDIPFTGDFPYSIVVADFDNNGRNDFATANSNSRNVSVYLQDNAGNFSPANGSPYFILANRTPRFINIGDFNNDQKLDIVIANEGTSGGFAVLLGQIGGSFGNLTNFVTDADNTKQVLVGDITSDNRPDLILANSAASDKIFLRKNTCSDSLPANSAKFDYDGDRKTDLSIFRPPNGQWWLNQSSNGNTKVYQFGQATDKITPADYTGDGKTDVAFFRNGNWFVLRSENDTFFAAPFGTSGDIPAPGDYDGDAKADLAVFRPTVATWFILQSSNQQTRIVQFGANGDVPMIGDYDGDGKSDIAIFRPTNGTWWLNWSSNNTTKVYQFGNSADKPVQADYTGDGKTDVAFFRNGQWFILRSENETFFGAPFGAAGDIPAPGDYDGDGKADLAVFRSGTWFILRSTQGTLIQQFGAVGDIPAPAAYIP
jgi:hypothetical protein